MHVSVHRTKMSYILCRWLNTELRLSQIVGPKTFARDFSNGYLIGEILHKYDLQTDFDMFRKDDNKSSKANNFSRLKPTLQMLGISLDETTAQELMEGKQSVALHLIYALYVALKNKNKIIGGSLESFMSNASSAYRRKKEQDLYSERLHRGFDSADPKPGQMSQLIQDEDQQLNLKLMEATAQQKEPLPVKERAKRRMNLTTTFRESRLLQKQQEQQRHREIQAQIIQNEIHKFEENTKKITISATSVFCLEEPKSEAVYKKDIESQQCLNSEYIEQIRQRLKEDVFTQKQKERRAVQFVVEQSKARKAEQDAQIEESLVKHLTRQTKVEKRLVSQLLQIRSQKEELIKNNLTRQQQFQQRREKDLEEALDREAALARQERLAHAAEIQRNLDMCNKLVAERKQKRYMKHFNICKEILGQIVDLVTKAGDYRLLTSSIIPEKQMKEWKEFLLCGLPLYETVHEEEENMQLSPVELLKQDELNKLDYEEYENMVGEWAPPEEAQLTEAAPPNSSILDHVIVQMRNIVHPPPAFPPFILKACVLGKSCSGKTACLDKIAQAHGFYILSADKLVEEVLSAYHSKDEISDQQTNSPAKDDEESAEKVTDSKLTKWALLGEAADKMMTEGKALSNELLVDIIKEAIRQLPAYSGWILDGFPLDISQAHLLEKALGGAVEEVDDVNLYFTNPSKVSAPALDLALLLDVSDGCVVPRAAKHTDENKLAEISSRVAAFEDTWPQVEEWFGAKQNILVRVNADVDEEELFKAVESIIQQVNQPTEGPSEASFNHEHPPSIVDEPLPTDLAASICLHWDTIYESYVNKVKAVFQQLRGQHAAIDLHFINLGDEFKLYLNRTDPKQDLISQWQKDYNKAPLHVRQNKAQLLRKLDDLLEELWHISDTRREENEQKIFHVKEDGWLVDCTDILLQHHSTLIQVEIERLQDILVILKTYYLSLCKQTMPGAGFNVQEECMHSKIRSHEKAAKPLSHENLICDADKAYTAIKNMVLAESLLFNGEARGPKDKKEISPHLSTDINNFPAVFLRLNQEQADFNMSETGIINFTVLNKIYNKYLAALNQEGDATKARIALIKGHSLKMVDSLQSSWDYLKNTMKELVTEQFMVEMKSIDCVAEVARHHMDSDPELQNGLDLASSCSLQTVNNNSVIPQPAKPRKIKLDQE